MNSKEPRYIKVRGAKVPDAKTGNAFNTGKYCVFAISVTY